MALSLDDLDLGLGTVEVPSAATDVPIPPFDDVPVATRPAVCRTTAAHKGVLYFDLETIPDYQRLQSFGLDPIPNPDNRTPKSDCPPPEKLLEGTLEEIKARVRKLNPEDSVLSSMLAIELTSGKSRKGVHDLATELRCQDATRDELIGAQRKMMACSPEMNRIVAFGWSCGDGINNAKVVGVDGCTEIEILNHFWMLARSGQVCGFNVLGFDLPTIFVRSMVLDIVPSRQFDLKPWGNDVIDLMAKRWPKGPAMKLKRLAEAMGIPIEAEGVDGSQSETLWKTDPAKLGDYVRSDVQLVKELHRRYRGFFC